MASVDESEGEAGIAGQGRGLGSTGTTLQHVLFLSSFMFKELKDVISISSIGY